MIDDDYNKNKFENIYRQYKSLMFYIANKICNDYHLSEDIVQESFLSIAKNIKNIRIDNPYETKAYIAVITQHNAYKMCKKMNNEYINDDEEFIINASDSNIDYENYTVNLIHYDEIVSNISLLDKKYSLPLQLQAFGYKISEISSALNISESATKMRIKRAKIQLYNLINGE